MSQLVATATTQLRGALAQAMQAAMEKGQLPQAPLPSIALEVPADRSHGDWSCNAAMAGARTFRMAPVKIAQAIQENLDLSGTYFDKCEIAGPGFLNFTYEPRFYGEVLQDIHRLGGDYGRSDYGHCRSPLPQRQARRHRPVPRLPRRPRGPIQSVPGSSCRLLHYRAYLR